MKAGQRPTTPDGFDRSFFAGLADIEEGHFWFRARNELILRALRLHAPRLDTIHEIGCGTGYVLRGIRDAFPDSTLSASELFAEGLMFAAARVPSATFYRMDARHIPFDSEFDAVGAFDVLEHITEDRQVVGQVYKALKPGGIFVATVPQHEALWSRQDVHAHHVRRYSQRRMKSLIAGAGLVPLEMHSFVSLLLPAMVASRVLLDRRRNEIEGVEALSVPRRINAAFSVVMRLERALIEQGFVAPAGGSLLVVARKPVAA